MDTVYILTGGYQVRARDINGPRDATAAEYIDIIDGKIKVLVASDLCDKYGLVFGKPLVLAELPAMLQHMLIEERITVDKSIFDNLE